MSSSLKATKCIKEESSKGHKDMQNLIKLIYQYLIQDSFVFQKQQTLSIKVKLDRNLSLV